MHNQFLIGEKIYLRAIEESDLNESYRNWFNDEEVCKFNSHHRFPNYNDDMSEYYKNTIKSRNNLVLAIAEKESSRHIGNVSLQNIDFLNRTAELAIIIGNKGFWGCGIGWEACELIINHGFAQLNLNRIYCGTSEDNIGMQKLLAKLLFKKEGEQRSALFKNGNYKNTYLYGLLKNEYETTR
jgi:[ribosomal protein S5]-alanine N-acetyltransferase